jgi:hypothetical protein
MGSPYFAECLDPVQPGIKVFAYNTGNPSSWHLDFGNLNACETAQIEAADGSDK